MGIFDFFKKKNNENEKSTAKKTDENKSNETDEFTADMIKTSEAFVENSSERFSGLDFSVQSLQVVDDILEEASDFFDEMSEPQRQNIISASGAYIFEVARKNYGGKYFWYDQLKQPILVTGQPEFEVSILAFEKAKGRLENGKEDNIPFYFAGYTERVEKRESGMIV